MKILICVFMFFLFKGVMSAQSFVGVEDSILAEVFCQRYPEAMVNNCTQIDLSKQEFIDDTINLDDKLINDISPLLELPNTLWLELDGNSFDTIIGDFSELINLNQLDISLNRNLSKFPDFSTINSPTFEYLVINRMGLSDQPNLSSVKNSILEIEMKANEKYDIQNFLDFPKLESVNLHSNHLTFYDLKPLLADTIYPTYYRMFPQQELVVKIDELKQFNEGEKFSVGLVEDYLDEDNIYYWFKDNMLTSITDQPFFEISVLTEDDEGIYFGSVKNPAFPDVNDTLIIESFELNVASNDDCLTLAHADIIIESRCDDHQIIVAETGLEPMEYFLIGEDTDLSIKGNLNMFPNLVTGNYQLTITSQNCKITYEDYFNISSKDDCDEVLSPNGDGIGDTYYIEQESLVKVVDKFGEVLRTIQGPEMWDGKDAKGKLLTSGYYLLISDTGERIDITIER